MIKHILSLKYRKHRFIKGSGKKIGAKTEKDGHEKVIKGESNLGGRASRWKISGDGKS